MNIFDLPVHPKADIFPMLDQDELTNLAADIKLNGLRHPIVIGDVEGVTMLIDGRNRLAACKIAGVEPKTKQMNGEDPETLILSENIHRRHLNKSQVAMSVAMMFPKGQWQKKVQLNGTLVKEYVRQARKVSEFAKEEAAEIIAGNMHLPEAYEIAVKNEKAAETPPPTRDERISELREYAPDLADLVTERGANLEEQEAACRERKAEDARLLSERIEVFARCFGGAVTDTATWAYPGSLDEYMEIIDNKELAVMLRGTLLNGRDGIVPILERFIEGSNNIVNFIKQVEKHDGNT